MKLSGLQATSARIDGSARVSPTRDGEFAKVLERSTVENREPADPMIEATELDPQVEAKSATEAEPEDAESTPKFGGEQVSVPPPPDAEAMLRQIWDTSTPLNASPTTLKKSPKKKMPKESSGDTGPKGAGATEDPKGRIRDLFFDRTTPADGRSVSDAEVKAEPVSRRASLANGRSKPEPEPSTDASGKRDTETVTGEKTETVEVSRERAAAGFERKPKTRREVLGRIEARKVSVGRIEVRESPPPKAVETSALPPVPAPAVPSTLTVSEPAPMHTPPPVSQPMSGGRLEPERVPERIRAAIDNGAREVRIQLDPPELGGLDVRISVDAGEVRVVVRAEHADAAALFQQSVQELRHQLANAGLRLVGADVSAGRDERRGRGREQGTGGRESSGDAPSEERSSREHSRAHDVRAIA